MKALADYPEPVRRLWIIHEALRRLGFAPEDIYVSQHQEPIAGRLITTLDCTLKAQGKQFVVNCGHYPKGGIETDLLEWNELVERLNAGAFSNDELNVMFRKWPFDASRTQFVIALTMKGFKLPIDMKSNGTSKKATTDMIS